MGTPSAKWLYVFLRVYLRQYFVTIDAEYETNLVSTEKRSMGTRITYVGRSHSKDTL